MTSYQPAGAATEAHPLRPITNRLIWEKKTEELGTRVNNVPFERKWLEPEILEFLFFVSKKNLGVLNVRVWLCVPYRNILLLMTMIIIQ